MNKKEREQFQQANREAQLLEALLRVPGYAERLHARMTEQKASEKPIRELAVGEKAYTLSWAFTLGYDCWRAASCFPAERHTTRRIQRTKNGFVFLDGDKRGTEIIGD